MKVTSLTNSLYSLTTVQARVTGKEGRGLNITPTSINSNTDELPLRIGDVVVQIALSYG